MNWASEQGELLSKIQKVIARGGDDASGKPSWYDPNSFSRIVRVIDPNTGRMIHVDMIKTKGLNLKELSDAERLSVLERYASADSVEPGSTGYFSIFSKEENATEAINENEDTFQISQKTDFVQDRRIEMSEVPENVIAADASTEVQPVEQVNALFSVLTKNRGVTTVCDNVTGRLALVCKHGTISVLDLSNLEVVCTAKAAKAITEACPNTVAVEPHRLLVPVSEFNKVKKIMHPKRNISAEVREKRKARMKAYWEAKRAAKQETPVVEEVKTTEPPDLPQV